MGGFFNLDGPFYKWGTEVADIMILSLLWLVCSIPIVTIGASTTALFYVYGKKVRKEDPYIVKPFFKSFKENFVQATILTFLLGLMALSGFLYYRIITSGQAPAWVQVLGLFFIIQVIFVSLYLFPVLSRFEMTVKNIIITSFLFANKHFITSVLCGILFLVAVFLVVTLTPLSPFAFGLYALVASFLFQRVFTKNIDAALKEKERQNEDEKEAKVLDEIEEENIETEELMEVEDER